MHCVDLQRADAAVVCRPDGVGVVLVGVVVLPV
jgi:hypothetical protein